MPIGYLASVVLAASGTVLALTPLRRPPALAKLSWLQSIAVNELPLLAIVGLLAATVLAIAEGDIDSPGARVLVGLAVLTMVGLAVLARRGARARQALDDALSDGLGPGWRATLDADMAGLRRHRPLARILFAPLPWLARPGSVERVANISYGNAGRRNLLDVYRHRAQPSGGPTLIYFHGGGYFSGRKSREARPLLHRLASQGWTCISANYRLRPQATFPDHLIDAKKVIAWVREHGHEHGADPSVLFVAGSSAGGHLSAFAALTPNEPAFQPGFERVDTSVTAAVCLYGYFGNYYGQGPASSPQAYTRPDAPPFFVAQGDHDTYSPRFLAIARRFAEQLRDTSSNPVVYAELPGGQHSFDLFHSLRFEAVIDAIEAFAVWVRSRQHASGPDQVSRISPPRHCF